MSSIRAWTGRHVHALSVTAIVLVVAVAVWSTLALAGVTSRQDRTEANLAASRDALAAQERAASVRAAQRNALAQDVQELRAQVLRCKDLPADAPGCGTPVAPPPSVTVRSITGPPGPAGAGGLPGVAGVPGTVGGRGPVGAPGVPGTPGPAGGRGDAGQAGAAVTGEQVAAAVADYCGLGRCAAPPSPLVVQGAVATYCADGRCDGDPGDPGRDGQAGDPGAPGPGPTAEQVAAAVADYCAVDGRCQGPPGDPGPAGPAGPPGADSAVPGPQGAPGDPGAPGADGRGITAIACDGPPVELTITYTDGATQTVACDPAPSAP